MHNLVYNLVNPIGCLILQQRQANQNYSTTTTQDTDGDGVTDDIDLDDDNDGISDVDEKLQDPNTFPAILNNAYKSKETLVMVIKIPHIFCGNRMTIIQ